MALLYFDLKLMLFMAESTLCIPSTSTLLQYLLSPGGGAEEGFNDFYFTSQAQISIFACAPPSHAQLGITREAEKKNTKSLLF